MAQKRFVIRVNQKGDVICSMIVGNKTNLAGDNDENKKFLQDLFYENYEMLYNYARYMSGSSSSEDLVQDTFLIASSKIDAVRNSVNPVGWLIKTLKNCILKERQKERKKMYNESNDFNFERKDLRSASNFEDFSLFRESCLQHISEEDWILLCKYYGYNYTSKELAEESGLKESTCRMKIKRAKEIILCKVKD